jgi:glycine cleavage system H protein
MATMRAKKKSYPLIPEDERKCIWMATGLISYKLCDRNYRCDICPFDRAIKNEESGDADFRETDEDWTEGSPLSDPSIRINGAVFYHPDHCWVKVESPEKVRIGIDNLLSQLIGDVNAVILPKEGSFAFRGECCAHVIQEYYILPVVSPLSGLIQSVNPRLMKEPGLVAGDPGGEGWLMTVKPGNLEKELKDLLFGRRALSWYQREEKEIMARTDSMLRKNLQKVGLTMQDGGVRIGGLKDLLNSATSRQKAQILDSSLARHGNFRRLMTETMG